MFGNHMSTPQKIGLFATIFICGGLTLLAASAWFTHFEWEKTGAYSRNSFPMEAAAKDLSCWTGASVMIAALVWWRILRRKPPGKPKTLANTSHLNELMIHRSPAEQSGGRNSASLHPLLLQAAIDAEVVEEGFFGEPVDPVLLGTLVALAALNGAQGQTFGVREVGVRYLRLSSSTRPAALRAGSRSAGSSAAQARLNWPHV